MASITFTGDDVGGMPRSPPGQLIGAIENSSLSVEKIKCRKDDVGGGR